MQAATHRHAGLLVAAPVRRARPFVLPGLDEQLCRASLQLIGGQRAEYGPRLGLQVRRTGLRQNLAVRADMAPYARLGCIEGAADVILRSRRGRPAQLLKELCTAWSLPPCAAMNMATADRQ